MIITEDDINKKIRNFNRSKFRPKKIITIDIKF